MKRVLAIALGLLIGLGVATLADMRLAHLRLVAGGHLPAWTEAADPASGLREGRIPGATELRWRFAGLGAEGLRWQLVASGPGLRVEATLWLPPRALLPAGADDAPVRLSDLRGRIELGALEHSLVTVGDAAGNRPEGSLQVTGGEGWLDLRRGTLVRGTATGRIEAVRLDGESLGGGPFRAELASDGGWQMQLALNGGVAPLEAVARGWLPEREVELEIIDTDATGEGLPRSWRGSLGTGGDGSDGDRAGGQGPGGAVSQAVRLVHLGE